MEISPFLELIKGFSCLVTEVKTQKSNISQTYQSVQVHTQVIYVLHVMLETR